MPLTDAQVDQLLNQQITQHEAEMAAHRANLAKLGVFLAASVPGSPDELAFISGVEEGQKAVATLNSAVTELKRTAGQPNSEALLRQRATDVVALAAQRKRNRPPGATTPQRAEAPSAQGATTPPNPLFEPESTQIPPTESSLASRLLRWFGVD